MCLQHTNHYTCGHTTSHNSLHPDDTHPCNIVPEMVVIVDRDCGCEDEESTATCVEQCLCEQSRDVRSAEDDVGRMYLRGGADDKSWKERNDEEGDAYGWDNAFGKGGRKGKSRKHQTSNATSRPSSHMNPYITDIDDDPHSPDIKTGTQTQNWHQASQYPATDDVASGHRHEFNPYGWSTNKQGRWTTSSSTAPVLDNDVGAHSYRKTNYRDRSPAEPCVPQQHYFKAHQRRKHHVEVPEIGGVPTERQQQDAQNPQKSKSHTAHPNPNHHHANHTKECNINSSTTNPSMSQLPQTYFNTLQMQQHHQAVLQKMYSELEHLLNMAEDRDTDVLERMIVRSRVRTLDDIIAQMKLLFPAEVSKSLGNEVGCARQSTRTGIDTEAEAEAEAVLGPETLSESESESEDEHDNDYRPNPQNHHEDCTCHEVRLAPSFSHPRPTRVPREGFPSHYSHYTSKYCTKLLEDLYRHRRSPSFIPLERELIRFRRETDDQHNIPPERMSQLYEILDEMDAKYGLGKGSAARDSEMTVGFEGPDQTGNVGLHEDSDHDGDYRGRDWNVQRGNRGQESLKQRQRPRNHSKNDHYFALCHDNLNCEERGCFEPGPTPDYSHETTRGYDSVDCEECSCCDSPGYEQQSKKFGTPRPRFDDDAYGYEDRGRIFPSLSTAYHFFDWNQTPIEKAHREYARRPRKRQHMLATQPLSKYPRAQAGSSYLLHSPTPSYSSRLSKPYNAAEVVVSIRENELARAHKLLSDAEALWENAWQDLRDAQLTVDEEKWLRYGFDEQDDMVRRSR